jgi:hypothetical protein
MKLLSWDQQLGLASPLPYAANQSGKTQTPSKNETGLDASRHTQVSAEGAEKNFLLDILFHRMSAIAMQHWRAGCRNRCLNEAMSGPLRLPRPA